MFKEIAYGEARPIEGYGPGFFRLGGAILRGPHLIWPEGHAPWAGLEDEAALTAFADRADVLLLGMGDDTRPLASAIRMPLEAAGLGVEVMSTPSAARTYNVLLAEGRRILAALIPVGGAGRDAG